MPLQTPVEALGIQRGLYGGGDVGPWAEESSFGWSPGELALQSEEGLKGQEPQKGMLFSREWGTVSAVRYAGACPSGDL
jgi:hypothetical protein